MKLDMLNKTTSVNENNLLKLLGKTTLLAETTFKKTIKYFETWVFGEK